MSTHPNKQGKIILMLTLPLTVLLVLASLKGMFTPGIYNKESFEWTIQTIGQDSIDLLIVAPCLLITAWLSYRGSKIAALLWGGVLSYITYIYVIYAFAVHFNNLFWIYCSVLGLSFYSYAYFILSHVREPAFTWYNEHISVKLTGIYLIVVATAFYILWMSDILPAIAHNTIPENLEDIGLITNPVQALDLSVALPGLSITGVLLIQKKTLGFLLAPIMLVFTVLMDITISCLTLLNKIMDSDSGWSVFVLVAALTITSIVLLVMYLRALHYSIVMKK